MYGNMFGFIDIYINKLNILNKLRASNILLKIIFFKFYQGMGLINYLLYCMGSHNEL